MHALQHTTHPSAFDKIRREIEKPLRTQSYVRFIQWSVVNGNRARVRFARTLGLGITGCTMVGAIIMTLSVLPRYYRVTLLPAFFLSGAMMVAAWKGMCVVLHGLHARHVRPWELFQDEETNLDYEMDANLTEATPNSYEDQPWIARYEKRNLIRKIFDREIWVSEPALRQIQETIAYEACLLGLLFAIVMTGIFCAFPSGDLY